MEQNRRQARMDRRKAEQRRNQMRWLAYIVIAAVVLTAILIYANQVRTPDIREYTQANGNQLGDPNAPVSLVEYADFQCIHCYNFYAQTQELVIENHVETGEVFYELRVIGIGGQESLDSAEAAYCAADQNKFWEYHDAVFANYSSGNSGGYTESRLIDFGETVGLDLDQFASCLASDEKLAVIDQYYADAQADSIGGTPAFLLNGQVLAGGNLPYVQLQAAIETALGQ